jgi:hypothetical protein
MSSRSAHSRFVRAAAAALAALHLLGPCAVQCDDPSAGPVGLLRGLIADAPAATAEEPTCCRQSPEPAAPASSHDGCNRGCPGRAQMAAAAASPVAGLAAAGWVDSAPALVPAGVNPAVPGGLESHPFGGTGTGPVPRAVPVLLAASVLLV